MSRNKPSRRTVLQKTVASLSCTVGLAGCADGGSDSTATEEGEGGTTEGGTGATIDESATTDEITTTSSETSTETEESTEMNSSTETGTETNPSTETGTKTSTASNEADILLGGKVEAWVGQKPARIDGQNNPTLQLTAGTEYTLIWGNLDSAEHELIIENANGQELAATESASQQGETRSLTFTASQKMAEYYCEYHPQSMRGTIEVSEE
ncbi:Copper binding protein, plastocyanin/azurin family [Halogranum amylolyticum]|uniref:Copper binding protein, plastocyanin/azurin family n=1 Tax=Halogranum amylolyticum TaxID=660520 RepID=A0A1H8UGJ6_9EURY|nr:plastocyanin/azurin family copper-binding protein [Halogranum amylolyticum]SEP02350.1 Copper binding protein, plastocyanin/azurin family [Halogranum amylolyticum]